VEFNFKKLITLIGWIGGICFAICGAPQAIQSIQQGHADGVNPYFIGLWLSGELLTMVYVYGTRGFDKPLFFNYILNVVFISIICYHMV
jgi:uncharacterized protein with PQ loop repeat